MDEKFVFPMTGLWRDFRTEWGIWSGMKQRCNNPKTKNFHRYGGRGIKVCDRWNSEFRNFLCDMGLRPAKGLSIDRIDNNGHYSCGKCWECIENHWPANYRWATKKEQGRNRDQKLLLTYNGETKQLVEWSEILGGEDCKGWESRVQIRLKQGWSVEEAFTRPANRNRGGRPNKNSKLIAVNGESMTILFWSRKLGMSATAIESRIKAGWTPEEAVTIPKGVLPHGSRISISEKRKLLECLKK